MNVPFQGKNSCLRLFMLPSPLSLSERGRETGRKREERRPAGKTVAWGQWRNIQNEEA